MTDQKIVTKGTIAHPPPPPRLRHRIRLVHLVHIGLLSMVILGGWGCVRPLYSHLLLYIPKGISPNTSRVVVSLQGLLYHSTAQRVMRPPSSAILPALSHICLGGVCPLTPLTVPGEVYIPGGRLYQRPYIRR